MVARAIATSALFHLLLGWNWLHHVRGNTDGKAIITRMTTRIVPTKSTTSEHRFLGKLSSHHHLLVLHHMCCGQPLNSCNEHSGRRSLNHTSVHLHHDKGMLLLTIKPPPAVGAAATGRELVVVVDVGTGNFILRRLHFGVSLVIQLLRSLKL